MSGIALSLNSILIVEAKPELCSRHLFLGLIGRKRSSDLKFWVTGIQHWGILF
jgi:hypothetical protein